MTNRLKALIPVVVMMALVVMSVVPGMPAKAQSEPVTIKIFVGLGTGYLPEQQAAQVALADEWNAAHDDIKVEFEFHDNDTARDELLTRVAAGDAPAIVGPAGVRSVYETSELWADLTSYIERDSEELGLDDFDAASLGLYELGDKTIALPFGVYPSFMYVNETIFNDAEVELPPTEIGAWSWADLRDKAMAVTQDANGVYLGEEGFDPDNIEVYGYFPFWTNFRASTILFSPTDAGVQLNDDGTVTATFNQEAIQQAVQFYQDAIFVDHFEPNIDAENAISEGVTNPFVSGRVAMGASHTWLFGGMQEAISSGAFTDQWNVYPIPAAPNGITTARVHADTFAIMDSFENKDAAWEVLKWLTSGEPALQLATTYGAMPARLSLRSDWEATWLEAFPQLNLDVVYGALEYLDAPNHEGYMPNYARAWDALEQYWNNLRSQPDFDAIGELDAVNAQVQELFDEALSGEATDYVPTAVATEAAQ
ncbi:extracellular solute-binding protein [Aggregatilinea lenta]|uniref:extracellular solute-binding protein n=1 Tax=Aggregatilinea lenta TaxID=913108 RepID=UPI0013C31268|nr:extracellular solute-binding protein [Aggregatilinea lenta]